MEACKKILKRLPKDKPVNLTFHRAFDVARDALKAAEIIKDMGFSRILTNGQVSQFYDLITDDAPI